MADGRQTLLLSRSDVERLLAPAACLAAVEQAFRDHALGRMRPPGVLGMHVPEGSFHVKAAGMESDRAYFAAKMNANFPANGARHGLPTIQGVVVLFDAGNGAVLAVMDSMSITALRTAAATALAAKHLARERCETLLICGSGAQAPAHLRALLDIRKPRRVLAYDIDASRVAPLRERFSAEPVKDLAEAVRSSDIVVTCSSATRHYIELGMVRPGTFVAGVGADNEHKQELDPQLLARCKLVTDLTEQCAVIGDLHHALEARVMSRDGVHAQLGEIAAGLKRGRESDDEITVFDSTGTALQDVAAAALVYERALELGAGHSILLND